MRRSQSRIHLLRTPLLWTTFWPFLLVELFFRQHPEARDGWRPP